MAGAMRKMGVYLGLVEDDDPDYDAAAERQYREDRRDERGHRERLPHRDELLHERDYHPEERYEEPARPVRPAPAQRRPVVPPAPERRSGAPVAAASVALAEPYRITTLHPRTYNEARQIGEQFREGTPVIMNLTEMDDVDAKRLVDFAAGLVFGCHGTIERVTQKVFLLSPANVDVTAEDKARIAEGGFFNQS
jgi:cell division inhibitor SepF